MDVRYFYDQYPRRVRQMPVGVAVACTAKVRLFHHDTGS